MDDTFIKLYRSVKQHPRLSTDNNAYIVFTRLLLHVNKEGKVTLGRKQLGAICNLKPTTAWGTLRRLCDDNMVTTKSTNKFTEITVVNWSKFQAKREPTRQPDDSAKTASRQPDDTIIRIEKNRNNIYVEIQRIFDLYLSEFNKNGNQYKLTPQRRSKLQARLKDAGAETLERAIKNVASTSFYMGDNDRGWKADLDFIIRSYEQTERLANMKSNTSKSIDEVMNDEELWKHI